MNPKTLIFSVILALAFVSARAARMFVLDDGEYEHLRYRRQVPEGAPALPPNRRQLEFNPLPPVAEDLASAGSSSYGHSGYKPGRVGPVYTFVKTDPYGNAKWGVRHVAGKKYAHGRR